MTKQTPESPWVEPVAEREVFALMATALNRIAIALEAINERQKKSNAKRIVLKGGR